MEAIDFSRSFCTFTGPRNNARLQVESQLELIDDARRVSEVFLLYASCKSEDTYAKEDLFQDPNYDFCGIFSKSKVDYSIIRTYSTHKDNLETGLVAERFTKLAIDLAPVPTAKVLPRNSEIIQATLRGEPLVSRTELADPSRSLRAIVDCPIKTMNVHPENDTFQVDTGPMLYPDFTSAQERPIEWLRLAFVAFNRFDRADFVIQAATPVLVDGREVCQVAHYSRIVSLPAKNSIITLAV